MAKQPTKKSDKKRTRRSVAGARFSLFFQKGKTKIRLRLFPYPAGFRVSAIRKEEGKPAVRSVENFETYDDAQGHVDELKATSLRNGWSVSEGVIANNAGLFD